MKAYKGGEIVLVEFPYVGTTRVKRRPSLVVLDTGDDDIVVARITTQASRTAADVEISEWRQASLLRPSVVRLDKLATLEKRLVERKLGELTLADWTKAKAALQKFLAAI
ncbi:MAG: type II toxin-antitoxin system PemK/MazF family toxin [Planctomycetota bacterium]